MNASFLSLTGPMLETPVTEAPPRQEYNIQRRGARVRLRTRIAAKLQLWDVTLLDISRSGVLLAHTDRVRVGERCLLGVQVGGRPLTVMARAVRSFVGHFVPAAGDEQQIVYHTGMEFSALTDDTAQRISVYIHRLRASGLAP